MSDLRAVCISLVSTLDEENSYGVEEALNFAADMGKDLSVSHTKREVWKQLVRLLRKQLKQY